MLKATFKNLEVEMLKRNMTKKELGGYLKLCPATITSRFSGASDWRRREMVKIQAVLLETSKETGEQKELTLDYLFANDNKMLW